MALQKNRGAGLNPSLEDSRFANTFTMKKSAYEYTLTREVFAASGKFT